MRRILVTVVCCLAVAGLAVVAGASTTPSKTHKKSHSAKTSTHQVNHGERWGQVKTVNARTITIHNRNKGDLTFALSSSTKFREGEQDIKPNKLAAGSEVLIYYHMDGKSMVATSVHLHLKKAMSAKKKATEKKATEKKATEKKHKKAKKGN